MDHEQGRDEEEFEGSESEDGTDDASRDGGSDEPEGWAPWAGLSELQEAVGGIVETALRTVAPGTKGFPRYDLVLVPGEGYRVLIDLPGLQRDDIDLTISDRDLTVSGERTRPEFPEGAEVQRSERTYGGFRRTLRLPGDVDAAGIAAKMVNGVLEVTLPLREPGDAQKIEVR